MVSQKAGLVFNTHCSLVIQSAAVTKGHTCAVYGTTTMQSIMGTAVVLWVYRSVVKNRITSWSGWMNLCLPPVLITGSDESLHHRSGSKPIIWYFHEDEPFNSFTSASCLLRNCCRKMEHVGRSFTATWRNVFIKIIYTYLSDASQYRPIFSLLSAIGLQVTWHSLLVNLC